MGTLAISHRSPSVATAAKRTIRAAHSLQEGL